MHHHERAIRQAAGDRFVNRSHRLDHTQVNQVPVTPPRMPQVSVADALVVLLGGALLEKVQARTTNQRLKMSIGHDCHPVATTLKLDPVCNKGVHVTAASDRDQEHVKRAHDRIYQYPAQHWPPTPLDATKHLT